MEVFKSRVFGKILTIAKAYLRPYGTSKMEIQNNESLIAVNFFCKTAP